MDFFPGFTAGLLLINLSELGDKTFFIGMFLAMRHPRRWVFLGATSALIVMTVLSALLGQITVIFPRHYVQGVVVALFLGFGLKLLYEASRMASQKGVSSHHEQEEALSAVNQREDEVQTWSNRAVLMEAFSLTFLAEWGDRTQLATMTLAAAHHPLGVIVGASLGHVICAAIAVLGGKAIARRISERILTALGGTLFIIFGILAALEMV